MTKFRKNTRRKTPAIAPSMTAAAAKVGLPYEVLQAAKDAGCPAFRANNGVHCGELKAWLAEHPEIEAKAAESVDKEREEALLTKARREREEDRLKKDRRELIPADEVRRTVARAVGAAKNKLLNFPKRLAQEFALMDDAIAIEEKMTIAIHEALSELSRGEWAKLHCQHCGEEVKP